MTIQNTELMTIPTFTKFIDYINKEINISGGWKGGYGLWGDLLAWEE